MSAPAVVARELGRRFGAFQAVDRVSFEVAPGEVFGFLGSNGAGKTTTIRMLCGLLTPSSGTACVLGYDVARQPQEIKAHIGYMSQRFSLYGDLTVEENLRFWGGAYRVFGAPLLARQEWAIAAAGLQEQRRALARDLPGGFRQRLALVCALLHEPRVVFLDEPTAGVDPEARRRFWDLIDELAGAGTTVFVTTHAMDEAERCGRVALMHAGRVVALDTVPALKRMFPRDCVVEVLCEQPVPALAVARRAPGVVEVALFGETLHAVLDEPGRRAGLQAALREAGLGAARVEPIPASLEDVFIRVIGQAQAAP
jgi:ABC-2 type transport system ATP-binding protein